MGILQYARIFLAPTLQAKLYTGTLILEFSIWALLPTISVFFVGSITHILQSGDIDAFYGIVLQYIGFFFGINIFIALTLLQLQQLGLHHSLLSMKGRKGKKR